MELSNLTYSDPRLLAEIARYGYDPSHAGCEFVKGRSSTFTGAVDGLLGRTNVETATSARNTSHFHHGGFQKLDCLTALFSHVVTGDHEGLPSACEVGDVNRWRLHKRARLFAKIRVKRGRGVW